VFRVDTWKVAGSYILDKDQGRKAKVASTLILIQDSKFKI
jgi:hypothetical protein